MKEVTVDEVLENNLRIFIDRLSALRVIAPDRALSVMAEAMRHSEVPGESLRKNFSDHGIKPKPLNVGR